MKLLLKQHLLGASPGTSPPTLRHPSFLSLLEIPDRNQQNVSSVLLTCVSLNSAGKEYEAVGFICSCEGMPWAGGKVLVQEPPGVTSHVSPSAVQQLLCCRHR